MTPAQLRLHHFQDLRIFLPPGEESMSVPRKVVLVDPEAGYEWDKEKVSAHLATGSVYTVVQEDVSAWDTAYWLAEVPGVHFNSCHFEDASDHDSRAEDTDFGHPMGDTGGTYTSDEWGQG